MDTGPKKDQTGVNIPKTLELRIHGIRNTPPHDLLRSGRTPLRPSEVHLSWGDELAGFYRANPAQVASLGIGAAANGGSARLVEAYSWGRLARFTGIGIAGKIADAAVRTVWFLLMPFGLANAAYWSRPLPRVQQVPGADPATGRSAAGLNYAEGEIESRRNGAGRIRLFALLLTIYFVVTVAVVSMDLIAVQCFPADATTSGNPQPDRICAALPSFLDGMAGWSRGQRIALLSLLPLLGVGLLAGVAYLARTRFHPRPNPGGGGPGTPGGAAQAVPVMPTLMIGNLWDARKEIRDNGWLHMGASLGAVAAIIAWDGVWTRIDGASCGSLGTFFSECVPKLGTGGLDAAGIVMLLAWLGGTGAVIAAGIETVRKASDNPDLPSKDGSSWTVPIFLVAGASAAAAVVAAALLPCGTVCDGGAASRMLGLGTAPAALMFVMLLIILSMCFLKRNNYNKQALGWRGRGSAVFSTLALGAATIMSCAVVGATAAILQRKLERRSATDDGMWRFGAITDDVLFPPSVFTLFSGLLLAMILAVAAIWAGCSLLAVRKMGWNTHDAAVGDLLTAYNATPPLLLPHEIEAGRKLIAARRTASLAHRAEAVVSLLAVLIFLGLLSALVLGTFSHWWDPDGTAGLYGVIEGAGALGLATAGAAILALAVMSAKPNSRPLALLWDLMCFMPKAAHPFGPPSYGERAVPEFAARIAAWLDGGEGAPQPAGTGRVVISAHSLGAVIAVSALFHLRSVRPTLPFDRIGLVTYGTQLRSYFGRFFPDLFGPSILATTPVSRTKLTGEGDPETDRQDAAGPSGPAYLNLSQILGPGTDRWVNLYRKTDYLGFPVRYLGNAIPPVFGDLYAQEMDPFNYQFLVVSHSDYLQAPQYDKAIAAVVSGLPEP